MNRYDRDATTPLYSSIAMDLCVFCLLIGGDGFGEIAWYIGINAPRNGEKKRGGGKRGKKWKKREGKKWEGGGGGVRFGFII